MLHRHPWLFACAAPALFGCAEDTTASEPDERCREIADDCLLRQRGCVIEADAPTCRACDAGMYPTAPLAACAPIPGTAITHDFGDQTLAPGQEIGSLCQSWILDNDTELFVNAVELDNGGGYHHSNWFFVPEHYEDWPTEPWVNCYSEGFDELQAALVGGVIYAQSTQTRFELQKFQAGAVVRVPPRMRIIGATHLLNYNPEPLTTNLKMTLHTLPPEEVRTRLVPAQLVYSDLAIPAAQRSLAGGVCDLDAAHRGLFGGAPLDLKIHYILPHYHALGDSFSVSVVGGPEDGRQLVELGAYTTDPYGYLFNPPIDLAGATGVKFACGWDNPRDEVVRWGIGDQEMCEGLMFIESEMAFSAQINETQSVETVGGLEYHTGECNVLAFPFDTEE